MKRLTRGWAHVAGDGRECSGLGSPANEDAVPSAVEVGQEDPVHLTQPDAHGVVLQEPLDPVGQFASRIADSHEWPRHHGSGQLPCLRGRGLGDGCGQDIGRLTQRPERGRCVVQRRHLEAGGGRTVAQRPCCLERCAKESCRAL